MEFYSPLFNGTSFLDATHVALVKATEEAASFGSAAIPFYVLFIALEAIYSYFFRLKLYTLNDTVTSMTHGILGDLIVGRIVFPSIDLTFQCWIYQHYAFIKLGDSLWLSIIVFLGVDCGYYWMHRAAHEVNIFWAAHQVHHSSEHYNLSTATRQGLFQQAYAWFFFTPLAFFVPPQLFWIHRQINTIYQFWIHTQVITNLGPFLEFFLNTPSHHRVHHGRNPKYLDKNYAGILIIWDRMFGTFEPETEPVAYGLVHTLDFFNVFKGQLFHHFHIFKTALCVHTNVFDRLSTFFKGPGWMPGTARLGDPNDLPPFDPDAPVYNPPIHPTVTAYLCLQVLIAFAIFLFIIPSVQAFSLLDLMITSYLALLLLQISLIFENPRNTISWEPIRIAIFLAIYFYNWDIAHGGGHHLWWIQRDTLSLSNFQQVILPIMRDLHVLSLFFVIICQFKVNWTSLAPVEVQSAKESSAVILAEEVVMDTKWNDLPKKLEKRRKAKPEIGI